MPRVKLNQNLSIDVLCPYRWSVIQPYLLRTYYQISEACGLSPIFRVLNQNEALIQSLADQLDELVEIALERDLQRPENSRVVQGWVRQGLSEKQALDQYLYYRDRRQRRGETLSGYFPCYLQEVADAVNPDETGLSEQMGIIANQFIRVIQGVLERIQTDFEVIIRAFFPEMQDFLDRIILKELQAAGADLHKGGQQVMLLKFALFGSDAAESRQRCWEGKLVYKPSTVLADMMLMGNVELLKERGCIETVLERLSRRGSGDSTAVDPATICSAAELLNRHLSAEPEVALLPTYLILPLEAENPVESYGYVQHLSHLPWFHQNLRHEIMARFLESPDEDLDVLVEQVQEGSWVELTEIVSTIAKDPTVALDFIARSEMEYLRFSEMAGLITFFALMFGIKDIHFENLIVTGLSPVPIDLEVSFQSMVKSVQDTDLLTDVGGLRTKKHAVSIDMFINELQRSKIHFEVENKNHLYRIEEGVLVACNPDIGAFMRGFDRLALLLPGISHELMHWMHLPVLSKVVVRYLPCSTQSFKANLELAKYDQFSRSKFIKHQAGEILKRLRRHFIEDGGVAELHNVLKICYIFLDNELSESLSNFNIPVYYALVTSQFLLNEFGHNIEVNVKKLKVYLLDYIRHLEDERIGSEEELANWQAVRTHLSVIPDDILPEKFFTETFLESSIQRLQQLTNNRDYQVSIRQEVLETLRRTQEVRPMMVELEGGVDTDESGCGLSLK